MISTWAGHVPNPHAKPGPDYLAMNKAAADSGLTKSKQIRGFRCGSILHVAVSRRPPACMILCKRKRLEESGMCL